METPVRDLKDQKFGFERHPTLGGWTVLSYVGKGRSKGRFVTSVFDVWRCKCRCGWIADIPAANLLKGHSTGCVTCGHAKAAETIRKPPRKYERVWQQNKRRMCPEWQVYAAFAAWRELQPVGGLYRRDESLPHSPDNTSVSKKRPCADDTRERTIVIRMNATGETREQATAWFNGVSRQRQQQYREKYEHTKPQPRGRTLRKCNHGVLRVNCDVCKAERRERNRLGNLRRARLKNGIPLDAPLSKRGRPRLGDPSRGG